MFSKQLIVVPSVIRQATIILNPQRHNSAGAGNLNSASLSCNPEDCELIPADNPLSRYLNR